MVGWQQIINQGDEPAACIREDPLEKYLQGSCSMTCIGCLTCSMDSCPGPALEGRPRGVSGRLHRAAPVVQRIRARRYHLQTPGDSFPRIASVPIGAALCKPWSHHQKYWSCMRCDDATALLPTSVQLAERAGSRQHLWFSCRLHADRDPHLEPEAPGAQALPKAGAVVPRLRAAAATEGIPRGRPANAQLGLWDAAGAAAAKRGVAGDRLQPAGVPSAAALRRRLLLVPHGPRLRVQVARLLQAHRSLANLPFQLPQAIGDSYNLLPTPVGHEELALPAALTPAGHEHFTQASGSRRPFSDTGRAT